MLPKVALSSVLEVPLGPRPQEAKRFYDTALKLLPNNPKVLTEAGGAIGGQAWPKWRLDFGGVSAGARYCRSQSYDSPSFSYNYNDGNSEGGRSLQPIVAFRSCFANPTGTLILKRHFQSQLPQVILFHDLALQHPTFSASLVERRSRASASSEEKSILEMTGPGQKRSPHFKQKPDIG